MDGRDGKRQQAEEDISQFHTQDINVVTPCWQMPGQVGRDLRVPPTGCGRKKSRRVVDAAPYLAGSEFEGAAGLAAEDHEDLSQDADGDFRGGVGANIQAEGGVDAGELFGGEAGQS